MSASPTDHQPRQPPAPPSAFPIYLPESLIQLTGHLSKMSMAQQKKKILCPVFLEGKSAQSFSIVFSLAQYKQHYFYFYTCTDDASSPDTVLSLFPYTEAVNIFPLCLVSFHSPASLRYNARPSELNYSSLLCPFSSHVSVFVSALWRRLGEC